MTALARPLRQSLALFALALGLGASAHPGEHTLSGDDLAYQELAETWLARQGYAPQQGLELPKVISDRFFVLPLGVFEVWVLPDVLGTSSWGEDTLAVLRAILEAQIAWVDSVPPGDSAAKARHKAFLENARELSDWLEDVRPKDLADADSVRGQELLVALEAKEKLQAAAHEAATYMLAGGPLGVREEALAPYDLILVPERRDFVEFACVVALLDAEQRPYFWVPDIQVWTHFDFRRALVMSMEFAFPGADEYTKSLDMNAKNARGMEQQCAQLATRSLLGVYFGENLEDVFSAALANNVVIDVFEEVDTRTDGDLRTRSKAGRNIFVPGAASDGALPPNSAESRWRSGKGKDRFVGVLRQAQKRGEKEAETRAQKKGTFVLKTDDESARHALHAPLLGAGAEAAPTRFLGDYLEFMRAYLVAFMHWMRTSAGKGGKDSEQLFAELLRRLSTAGGEGTLEVFEEVYGIPLSAGSLEEASLEARFLAWLAKQRG